MENKRSYNLSFDIGTNSVGWCVTGSDNELLKFRNKNMWGARLFDEGQTAKERRLSRGTRRRYKRRKNRIELLRSLIGSEVEQKDSTFFIRMNEMSLWEEDKSFLEKIEEKRFGSNSSLFVEEGFTDIEYYNKFKTIYHLRKHLMESNEKEDIRLVYLALHHILKYRGNFIREGEDLAASTSLTRDIKELINCFEESLNIVLRETDVVEIESLLTDKKLNRKEKVDYLTEKFYKSNTLLSKIEKDALKEIAKALVGLKANYGKIFFEDEIKNEEGKDISVAFSDTKYEEVEAQLDGILGEKFYLVEKLKNLNSGIILNDILSGSANLSDAMVSMYQKHGEDLKLLKNLIKKEIPIYYFDMFRKSDEKLNNYYRWIDSGKCDIAEFYKYIENVLKKVKNQDNEDLIYIKKEMANMNFLKKINSKDNGAIPYQLHLEELNRIIEKQGKYYPVLLENQEKIKSILEFRIPYYVGPLNPYINIKLPKNKGFAWIVKKSNEKIYPWNFNEVVDVDKSAEVFIDRMRNTCTYLSGEEVLPKNSLLYSKYELLNELNKIRINDKLIDLDTKNNLINDVFLVRKSFKEKAFKQWLVNKNYYKSIEEIEIKGFQKEGEFASSLAPHIDFINILSDAKISSDNKKELLYENKEMIEEIIKWVSLFEDKKILKRKLTQKYTQLTDAQISKILKLKYKGWGSLSRVLLEDLKIVNNEGKKINIMSILEDSSLNFMQIINEKKFGFDKILEEKREKNQNGIISLEMIEDLHGSPAIKRSIWQTVKIADEIVKIMGYPPNTIYIEFARDDQESKRTLSRKKKLEEAYKILKDETDIYNSSIEKELKAEKSISNEKLFLYYTQNGKCMYSGETLHINELSNYEVDHILPQSYIYDDSFDNKVLVRKKDNQDKSDNLVLSYEIRKRMEKYWSKLKKANLISAKKYESLTRERFFDSDINRFLNRQLVETRQITKHVANLLKDCYKDSKVMAIKAGLTKLFRDQYDIPKLRELNDLHHAHDAYIASYIGNFISIRYPKLEGEFEYTNFLKAYRDQNRDTRKNKFGFVISSMNNNIEENGELLWDASAELLKALKILEYKSCNITKKVELKNAKFYNVNPEKSTKNNPSNKNLIEKKKGLDTYKYGGYSGEQSSYYIVLSHLVKNKEVKELLAIPIRINALIENGHTTIDEYIKETLNIDQYKILKNKIGKYQKINIKGTDCYIVGEGEVSNATQLKLTLNEQRLLSNILSNKEEQSSNESVSSMLDLWLEKASKFYGVYESDISRIKNFKSYGYFDLLPYAANTKEGKIATKQDLIKKVLVLTSSSPRVDLSYYNEIIEKEDEKLCKLSTSFGRKTTTIKVDEVYFIDESITGLYSKRYNL